MPSKLTLFPTDGPSRVLIFEEEKNHFVGRDPVGEMVLDDPRVSARHALFQWTADRWTLVDLRSKNGTFVNGSRISEVPLQPNDWISFGGLLTLFQRASEGELEEQVRVRGEGLQRLVQALAFLESAGDRGEAARRAVQSALELLEGERCFLIVFDSSGELEAQVASGFPPFEPVDERFAEILAAVERTLRTGDPVAASNAHPDAFQRGRRRTVEATVHALACAPVRTPDRMTGVLYVDRRRRGMLFSELELDVLARLAGGLAVAWPSLPESDPIRKLLGADGGPTKAGGSFLDELERKVRAAAFPPPRRAPRLTPHA